MDGSNENTTEIKKPSQKEIEDIENNSLYIELISIEPKILHPDKEIFYEEDLYSYSRVIKRGMGSTVDSISRKGLSLKSPMKRVINDNILFHRKAWGKELKDQLWENDIEVLFVLNS